MVKSNEHKFVRQYILIHWSMYMAICNGTNNINNCDNLQYDIGLYTRWFYSAVCSTCCCSPSTVCSPVNIKNNVTVLLLLKVNNSENVYLRHLSNFCFSFTSYNIQLVKNTLTVHVCLSLCTHPQLAAPPPPVVPLLPVAQPPELVLHLHKQGTDLFYWKI